MDTDSLGEHREVGIWLWRHIVPGVSAIGLAALMLLMSDLPKTRDSQASKSEPLRVVLLQMSSQSILDEAAQQVIVGLEESGFASGEAVKENSNAGATTGPVSGQRIVLTRLNAENDMATANAMATEVVSGRYDLVITLSTPCLQAVANANKRDQVRHVFGLVSDPTVAGVGVGSGPMDHPPYMVGIGTLPPAEKSFELAKQINPALKRVGVVWNPAEVNSEIATKVARTTCQKLGIELLEANAENTASVREAAVSLIAREIDALWIGGDITALSAADVLIQLANQAHIPVFTCMPGNAAKGALFDVGANYSVVGHQVGKLAARVLDGEEPAKIPWEVAIPPKLFLNKGVIGNLKGEWKFPKQLLDQADVIIDPAAKEPLKTTLNRPGCSRPVCRGCSIDRVCG
ncbi:ABC transporter substrate binding protein [Planctopirus ephydatiae]|uniref:ABC transporter substrate binding protein n=1 Tax=Planctopirus ephydatiae TaxID=2528019 RepID=A0A518GSW5_9PLAN|nr:ABC transporter substrate-binding protein [Planctopirus ephydatiae]QDV31673.1 ABC transporter substrate binding protein [Planctopirus ephydatiae]